MENSLVFWKIWILFSASIFLNCFWILKLSKLSILKENKSLSDFYNRRGKSGSSCYCKICSNDQALDRQRKFKIDCIEYKGGCCSLCGYKKYIGALEFHHKNPSEKDFTIANQKKTKFDDRIKKELDKCILVCANCHREIHGKCIL